MWCLVSHTLSYLCARDSPFRILTSQRRNAVIIARLDPIRPISHSPGRHIPNRWLCKTTRYTQRPPKEAPFLHLQPAAVPVRIDT